MTTQKTKTKTLLAVTIVSLAIVSVVAGFFWYGFRSWKVGRNMLRTNNLTQSSGQQFKIDSVKNFGLKKEEGDNTSQTIGIIGGASTGGITGGCNVFYGFLKGGAHPINTGHDSLPGSTDQGYVVQGRWGKGCRESFKIDSPPDSDYCKSISEEGYECGAVNRENYCLCIAK